MENYNFKRNSPFRINYQTNLQVAIPADNTSTSVRGSGVIIGPLRRTPPPAKKERKKNRSTQGCELEKF